jgi:hypothetical protein
LVDSGSPRPEACKQINRVIGVRFDDMSTPFAIVAWNRALQLDHWDAQQALTFAEQWQDSANAPETSANGHPTC